MSNYFRKMRKETGISVKAWAKLIGSNPCSIYNFEQGKTKPRNPRITKRIGKLVMLFDKLRNNPDYLIEIEQDEK